MLHIVIIAGGIGKRFWPKSKKDSPKQFITLLDNETLFEKTLKRIATIKSEKTIWVVGSIQHKELILKLAKNIPSNQILLEPFQRNTAASIAWAALRINKEHPDATMFILPADHRIKNTKGFNETLKQGLSTIKETEKQCIFGITPTRPHTGYGYIEVKNNTSTQSHITQFHEKPTEEKAVSYCKKGTYYWNSGMFLWTVKTFLNSLQENMPEHHEILSKTAHLEGDDPRFVDTFKTLKNISIDIGILEKTAHKTMMIKAQFDWNDLGSWHALHEVSKKDKDGNTSDSPLITKDSQNNCIQTDKKQVVLIGINNCVVIEENDTLFITQLDKDQEVQAIYDDIPDQFK